MITMFIKIDDIKKRMILLMSKDQHFNESRDYTFNPVQRKISIYKNVYSNVYY